jgi:hypothetical protein
LNIAPPALFVLGMGSVTYGWWPRFATTAVYGLVAWSFMIELIAAIITNRWPIRPFFTTSIRSPMPTSTESAPCLVGLALATATVGASASNCATRRLRESWAGASRAQITRSRAARTERHGTSTAAQIRRLRARAVVLKGGVI